MDLYKTSFLTRAYARCINFDIQSYNLYLRLYKTTVLKQCCYMQRKFCSENFTSGLFFLEASIPFLNKKVLTFSYRNILKINPSLHTELQIFFSTTWSEIRKSCLNHTHSKTHTKHTKRNTNFPVAINKTHIFKNLAKLLNLVDGNF
jgi:hypothetical protein